MLRNRIAHHEPIFARTLGQDHSNILAVLSYLSPPSPSPDPDTPTEPTPMRYSDIVVMLECISYRFTPRCRCCVWRAVAPGGALAPRWRGTLM